MSVIGGILHRDPRPVDPSELAGLNDGLAEFVHDHAHTWRKGSVGLSCYTLHVTPESPLMPMPHWDANAQLAIVADARLDNRDELSSQLGLPQENPDPAFLLAAYQRWGIDCPEHLLGDFAFAIWDVRQRRLFCARDFMGARPFYYYLTDSTLLFASDTAALFKAGVPLQPDLPFLAAHLQHGSNYPHRSRTCYEGIRSLPRASTLIVDSHDVQVNTYWTPDPFIANRSQSPEEAARTMLHILKKSVRVRLRSQGPVASHLSGGLDSSAVTVLAHRLLQERGAGLLAGYSWAPPPDSAQVLEVDERRLVDQIGRQEEIPIRFARCSHRDLLRCLFESHDLKSTSTVPEEFDIRRHARNEGCRLILSGWGGDEFAAFNGRGFLAEAFGKGQWRTVLREYQAGKTVYDHSFSWLVRKTLVPWLPTSLLRLRPSLLPSFFFPTHFPKHLRSDFQRNLEQTLPLPRRGLREVPGVRRVQLSLLNSEHLPRRIEAFYALGGRQGVTYAYPMLDRRLVEFVLQLPSDVYLKAGWRRFVFRLATDPVLPRSVCWNKSKREPALERSRSADENDIAKVENRRFLSDILKWDTEFTIADPKGIDSRDTPQHVFQNPVSISQILMSLTFEAAYNSSFAAHCHGILAER